MFKILSLSILQPNVHYCIFCNFDRLACNSYNLCNCYRHFIIIYIQFHICRRHLICLPVVTLHHLHQRFKKVAFQWIRLLFQKVVFWWTHYAWMSHFCLCQKKYAMMNIKIRHFCLCQKKYTMMNIKIRRMICSFLSFLHQVILSHWQETLQ